MKKEFTVNVTKKVSMKEFVKRLSDLPGYRIIEISENDARLKVGREMLFRLMGIYVVSDYTAPMKVSIEKIAEGFSVTTQPTAGIVKFGEKLDSFFNQTHQRIREKASGTTSAIAS